VLDAMQQTHKTRKCEVQQTVKSTLPVRLDIAF
jgi:hypothetical protein